MSFTPFNSMAIDPKYDHTHCLDHQTKKLLSKFTFALSFLFFSFFFSKLMLFGAHRCVEFVKCHPFDNSYMLFGAQIMKLMLLQGFGMNKKGMNPWGFA